MENVRRVDAVVGVGGQVARTVLRLAGLVAAAAPPDRRPVRVDDGDAAGGVADDEPMGGRRASLITTGAVPSPVPSCLQRNAQPSRR